MLSIQKVPGTILSDFYETGWERLLQEALEICSYRITGHKIVSNVHIAYWVEISPLMNSDTKITFKNTVSSSFISPKICAV